MEKNEEVSKGLIALTTAMVGVIGKDIELSDPLAKHRLMV